MLYNVEANQTPFLNRLGGLQGGRATIVRSMKFPVAQPYTVGNATQPAISESVSVSSNTATTVTRSQELNIAQIFQYTVEVSHLKQSATGEISGLSATGDQPVQDEFEFQKQAQLKKMAKDVEYSFIQGEYQDATDSDTAAKMRGLEDAISTNTVAGGAAVLEKDMIDELLIDMADNGAQFGNMAIMANAFNIKKISDVYGYAPESRNEGGVNIARIITNFTPLDVLWSPQMPTDEIYIVDLSVCRPVFLPYNGQIMVFEDLAQVAASRKGQWYAQIGLDYGPEEYHGSITNLATSE